jgi:hypothetical protein
MVLTPQAPAPPINLEVSDSDGSQFFWVAVKDEDTVIFNFGFEKVCCFSSEPPKDEEVSIKLIQASGKQEFESEVRWVYMSLDRLIWKLSSTFGVTYDSEGNQNLSIPNAFPTIESKEAFAFMLKMRTSQILLASSFFASSFRLQRFGHHNSSMQPEVVAIKETTLRAFKKFEGTEDQQFFTNLKDYVFGQFSPETTKIGVEPQAQFL